MKKYSIKQGTIYNFIEFLAQQAFFISNELWMSSRRNAMGKECKLWELYRMKYK